MFGLEWVAFQDGLDRANTQIVNGNRLIFGTAGRADAVPVLSDIRMMDAAMTARSINKVPFIAFRSLATGSSASQVRVLGRGD